MIRIIKCGFASSLVSNIFELKRVSHFAAETFSLSPLALTFPQVNLVQDVVAGMTNNNEDIVCVS